MSIGTRRRVGLAVTLATLALLGCREQPAPSAHSELVCADCHTGPARGLATHAAPTDACTACHADASLPDSVTMDGVRFAHRHAQIASGVPLPCSGCHSHSAGGEPLSVSEGNCFLCHAEPADTGVAMTAGAAPECLYCHAQPSHTAVTSSSTPINHALIVERGIACVQCHYDVLRGSGLVLGEKCVGCHGRARAQGRPPALSVDSLHSLHLDVDNAVACGRCHGQLSHEVVALASTISLNCGSCHPQPHGALIGSEPEWGAACQGCHSEAHRAQQQLYGGLGETDGALQPAPMFLARVSCRSCHANAAALAEPSDRRIAAIDRSCVECHGREYDFMLFRWQRVMEARTAAVERYLTAANTDPQLADDAAADSLVRQAREGFGLVQAGNGLHNIVSADALLRRALDGAAEAYRSAGLQPPPRPRLGPDPTAVSCAHCHYGVEVVRDSIYGEMFDHGAHVRDGSLACAACHTSADYFRTGTREPDPEHGRTTIDAAACQECHHVERAGACTACHTQTEMSTSAIRVTLQLDLQPPAAPEARPVTFRHADHTGVGCESCHASSRQIRAAAACSDCHEAHHGGATTCSDCHGEATLVAHSVENHFACTDCHARSTLELMAMGRNFCLSCHTEQVTHQPGRTCTPCHMQASPAEIKARILSR